VNRLDGKVILVTGGTSGLGRATTRALASAGARVVFTGRNEAGARETLAQLASENLQARFLFQDVTRESDWKSVIAKTLDEAGQLHGLVNNAGVSRLKPMEKLSVADVTFLLQVNVEGMFLGIKYAMDPIAEAGGGAIVNISALNGLRGSPNATGYCLAKAGTTHLARAAALEGRARGVRVHAVHPGVLFEDQDRPSPGAVALFGEAGAQRFVQHQRTTTPLGRLGHPRDIGTAVAFLMSDQARHVNGAAVVVDGGRMAGEFQHHGVASQA
jgi:NAD(P)-dependent dehydrogenase (short-subunit alcohol dehydrogenase family)